MSDTRTVELTVPGLLSYRDLAMRVVMEACRLVTSEASARAKGADGNGERKSLSDKFEFDDEFTLGFSSAFSEIYNNIVLHAYKGGGKGAIRFSFHLAADHLVVEMTDTGNSFDIDEVPPLEDPLPMGGMGIHIARTMLDELTYEPGPPNRWRLVKYLAAASDEQTPPGSDPSDNRVIPE